jgi:HNH endonuclease
MKRKYWTDKRRLAAAGVQLNEGVKDVLVDPEDEHFLREHVYYINANGYVTTSINRRTVFLHRQVMKAEPGQMVDHINGNRKDCRKANLRFSDYSENRRNAKLDSRNTTGATQIHFEGGYYRARAHRKGKRWSLGRFQTLEEAVAAQKQFYELHKIQPASCPQKSSSLAELLDEFGEPENKVEESLNEFF